MITQGHGHWRAEELELIEVEAVSSCTCGWEKIAESGSRPHMKTLSRATLKHVRDNPGHEVKRETTITAFYSVT